MTLLPVVEGLLRATYAASKPINIGNLSDDLIRRVEAQVAGVTALIPTAFAEYLRTWHFAKFDAASGDVPPSRHSFLHGVADNEVAKNPVFALRLFLMLDQMFFYI